MPYKNGFATTVWFGAQPSRFPEPSPAVCSIHAGVFWSFLGTAMPAWDTCFHQGYDWCVHYYRKKTAATHGFKIYCRFTVSRKVIVCTSSTFIIKMSEPLVSLILVRRISLNLVFKGEVYFGIFGKAWWSSGYLPRNGCMCDRKWRVYINYGQGYHKTTKWFS